MNRILLDTSVLVEMWRNRAAVPVALKSTPKSISTVTYIEFLAGANKRQKAEALALLADYEHIRLDPIICDKAIELIKIHSETDGLRLADALIAATCLVNDLDLLTLNRRHFQKIANLKLI